MIWTARLRTGHVVILRASGSRAFRAAALIASVAVAVDLVGVVIELVAEDSVVAVIASVAAGDLQAAALAALGAEVAGSGAGAEN